MGDWPWLVAEAVESRYRGRAAALFKRRTTGRRTGRRCRFCCCRCPGWRAILLVECHRAARRCHAPIHGASQRAHHHVLFRRSLSLCRHRSSLRRGVGARGAQIGTYWTCYTWLPSFLLHEMGQRVGKSMPGADRAGWQFVGMLLFGNLADRAGRRPAFCAYSLLTASALGFGVQLEVAQRCIRRCFWMTMLALGFGRVHSGFGALLAELFPDGNPAEQQWERPTTWRAPSSFGARGRRCDEVRFGLPVDCRRWCWRWPRRAGGMLPETRDHLASDVLCRHAPIRQITRGVAQVDGRLRTSARALPLLSPALCHTLSGRDSQSRLGLGYRTLAVRPIGGGMQAR